jgi:hypothetical protein
MNALVIVAVRCHWCGSPYEREIEPEWANIVRKFGICTPCYDQQEQARDMIQRCEEVEDGAA